MEEKKDEKQEKERLQFRNRGRYGEKTVLRRVPLSVVPLLDFLLDKMARAAQNDPRKTLKRVVDSVLNLAEQEQEKEQEKDRKEQEKASRYVDDDIDLDL